MVRLSISQGLAKSHQGDLVYDFTSKNTKFDLILPSVSEKKRGLV